MTASQKNIAPGLIIELRLLDALKPYDQNPRINDDAVDAVARSMEEFGVRQPIVVDSDGVIICGHTRWKAAKKLGLEKVPVHVATDLSPQQIKAYRIADNQTATLAQWDFELLPIELKDLQQADYDLSLLGFDEEALAQLLDGDVTAGLTDPDEVPLPPDAAVSVRGMVYQLGAHRLMCGDSSSADNLDQLLNGNQVHLLACDPPYNVKVEPRSGTAIAAGNSSFPEAKRKTSRHHQQFDEARGAKSKVQAKMRAKDRPLENDFVSDAAFEAMLNAWFSNAVRVMKPWASFYVWGGYANLANYPPALAANGMYFSQALIWDKQHPVLTRKDFMGAFEICFYGWLPHKKIKGGHQFYGPNNATDLWHVKKVNPQAMVHLTEKPVELAVRAIQYSSQKGENVLDLFGGSGSTLIGCEQTGRQAFLMEIDELYCDVIRQRWAEFVHGKGCDWQALTPAAEVGPCV